MSLFLSAEILAPNITHAYFQRTGKNNDFLKVGHKVIESQNENTFVLYDIFNPGETDKTQILFTKSKFFIPADLISIAFPLPIVFYSHTSTENALADLLYANLKMKKIIEEYESVQERSKKITWDSEYLFQQRDNTDSIYQVVRRLKEFYSQTTGEDSVSLNLKTYALVLNQLRSSRPSFGYDKRLRPIMNRPIINNTRAVHDQSYKDQYEREHFEAEVVLPKKIVHNPYREDSDPLSIRLFVKLANIIPYFLANKDEAVFYGIGFTFIFLFFSSIFKK